MRPGQPRVTEAERKRALRELRDINVTEWMVCERTNGHVVLALYCGLHTSALGVLGVLAQPWIRSRAILSKHRNALRFLRRPTDFELYQFRVPKGRPVARVVIEHKDAAPYFEPLWN